jgi:hypothetical protein
VVPRDLCVLGLHVDLEDTLVMLHHGLPLQLTRELVWVG